MQVTPIRLHQVATTPPDPARWHINTKGQQYMIQSLREMFFGDTTSESSPAAENVNEFQIATCVVLLEIAMADDEFSDGERSKIITVMESRFGLTAEDAQQLINVAAEHRANSRDLWHFTNIINTSCSHDEKCSIIDEVWHVVFADGSMDGHENYLAHQLGKLFNLTHGQLIESKSKVLKEIRNT
jgi:uncharacterized tellurite resistance protein B-like protein